MMKAINTGNSMTNQGRQMVSQNMPMKPATMMRNVGQGTRQMRKNANRVMNNMQQNLRQNTQNMRRNANQYMDSGVTTMNDTTQQMIPNSFGGRPKRGKKAGAVSCVSPLVCGGNPKTSAKVSYRRRVKSSKCRGLMRVKCRSNKDCKMTNGAKRQYCRTQKNKKRDRK
jgi:Sec-independent protein translocase protein TatA